MATVAVYGSLKRGFGNHTVMSRANGQFLAEAVSVDDHYILDGHGFPFINEAPTNQNKGKLSVELYEVPEEGLTTALDGLEGHPTFYKREVRPFQLANNETKDAWVYIYQSPITANPQYKQNGIYNW